MKTKIEEFAAKKGIDSMQTYFTCDCEMQTSYKDNEVIEKEKITDKKTLCEIKCKKCGKVYAKAIFHNQEDEGS